MEARERIAYPVLMALGALDAAGYSVIAPVTPAIARATGAGPALIGALVASFPVGIMVGFALAAQGVKRGRSTRVLLASLVLVALGSLGFVAGRTLGAYFAGRLVMGLGSGGVLKTRGGHTVDACAYSGGGQSVTCRRARASAQGVLAAKTDPVFILWGRDAQREKKLINTSRHTVIESSHPSPQSAHKGFFRSKPFSQANYALLAVGKEVIEPLTRDAGRRAARRRR